MTKPIYKTLDGNEAVAHVAFRTNEVIAIYPITPSSPMGEWADAWAAKGDPNIWGTIPTVVEMQSEAGAAGAVHGSLQGGSLTTTFTASQGLLLMIPNMYKIAGELTSAVFHVAARSVAAQALSIFGDHSDVMATRATGFALLSSNSVQEAMDMALIAQAATLESRVPFVHFFDGFRTSHEISKIEVIPDSIIREMINDDFVLAHRNRSLNPENPVLRGTAQNPDVFFQARETVNPFYDATPGIVQKAMDKFGELTGRHYKIFEYHGAPDAEHVIVLMGSGAETAQEAVEYMVAKGEKVGMIKVRLYRPFDSEALLNALPATTKTIGVLDRTKEPGANGEPLYLDCINALYEGISDGVGNLSAMPKVVGGRYGLSSKEFTPAMIKGIFDNLAEEKPKNHFTVGIFDDVTNTSLPWDPTFNTEDESVVRALFYGLGSDGTVGANKNSIKIIGENTNNNAQGFFVYDSKKAGAITVSHLRFGPKPIHATYLLHAADFVGVHQTVFLERFNVVEKLVKGGTFLLNSPAPPEEVWATLPKVVQDDIIAKDLKFYVIDAYEAAKKARMGVRINTIMQTCFFAISGVLPQEEAIAEIKNAIIKTYGNKGEAIVKMNINAVDLALDFLLEVPKEYWKSDDALEVPPVIPNTAPEFVKNVLGTIVAGKGDDLPVSAMPVDGTYPTGTTQFEKRNLALEIPVWEPDICIQCGKCVFVCPHAVIRQKAYDPALLESAPETFKSAPARERDWKADGLVFSLQVAPEDCTGCTVCVDVCPVKDRKQPNRKALNMAPQPPLRHDEADNWDFFLSIPEMDRRKIKTTSIRQQQVQLPLFEFSGACAGCGETPYVKLVSQLFGDRMVVANATGCSSIYGGNLPTTPWAKNAEGRGPAWSNSLFEDNAEFGLGMRLAMDKQIEFATELLVKLSDQGVIDKALAKNIMDNPQKDEADIYNQREYVEQLKAALAGNNSADAIQLLDQADMLVKKSMWIMGGDGWAYDIGYGGLDHVLASGRNVNILVMDTQVYSNTGGQMSKATPRAAVAKFAAAGKPAASKDLGLMAMTYGNVYVAKVAMGAKDEHTLRAFIEAEAYDGPSLIIAYSHCIAHGINMGTALQNQKMMVDTGAWSLYRYNPELEAQGENPFKLDSRKPKKPLSKFFEMENRFRVLLKTQPHRAEELFEEAQDDVESRYAMYEYLASRKFGNGDK